MATEMVAGRELDAQIARRVFGLCAVVTPGEPWWPNGDLDGHVRTQPDGTGGRTYLPHYSTKIEDAWPVFVWLTETTGRCIIIADMEEFDADNAVIVRCGLDEARDISEYWYPAPLALCRAALSWLDEKAAASESQGESDHASL